MGNENVVRHSDRPRQDIRQEVEEKGVYGSIMRSGYLKEKEKGNTVICKDRTKRPYE